MYEYLDRRYALALYEVAEKNGKVDEYLGDLREICELIDKDEEFQEVIKQDRKRRVGKECLALCRSRWSPYH